MSVIQVPRSASSSGLKFVTNSRSFEDPFSGTIQTASRSGNRWMITMAFNNVGGDDRAIMKGFIMELRGRANRFFTKDPAYEGPRGTAGGTPLVNGGSQVGNSLITDGWSAGATLLIGDEFQLDNSLKMVTANATADGGGNMTISFEPQIHFAPLNNAALDLTDPTQQFIMLNESTGWTDDPAGFSNFTLVGIEDVLA